MIMAAEAQITYLYNSGFIVKIKSCALVFDYYRDDNQDTANILQQCDRAYFFVSHSHFDHWNKDIAAFAGKTNKYFLSYDIHDAGQIPTEKIVTLDEYDNYSDENIIVKSFSSTDAGISFWLQLDEWQIFHAGDFNWWHWQGDSERNNAFARNGFNKQMKKLTGLSADIAFFPVDRRLEAAYDWGVKEFCRQTNVKNLVGMHNADRKACSLAADFAGTNKSISTWFPEKPGETKTIYK